VWIMDYLDADPIKSVNRNRHMNAFGQNIGDAFPETGMPSNKPHDAKNKGAIFKPDINDVKLVLSAFLAVMDWKKLKGITKINLLSCLTDNLKFKKEQLYRWGHDIDKDGVDALLVDLINYIGVRMGVDYGLYTKDLVDKPSSP
jgi:hypothetical protein